ncbi:MAG TPA: PaaI family thioesterase [Polyangia bacterium]|nr:PaaI family thioesterase [Polyangia bacterium]
MTKSDKVAARLSHTGLSKTLGEVVLGWGDGRAQVELAVSPAVLNPVGALHGGALATLIDSAGTIAIMATHAEAAPGVTTDLNVSYLAPTRAGKVVAEARAVKVGRTLAFAEVEVRRADGVVVAVGRITKYMG